jgi:hypothetical protein
MPVEPELCQLAEISVTGPDVARIAVDEQAKFFGPAVPD